MMHLFHPDLSLVLLATQWRFKINCTLKRPTFNDKVNAGLGIEIYIWRKLFDH